MFLGNEKEEITLTTIGCNLGSDLHRSPAQIHAGLGNTDEAYARHAYREPNCGRMSSDPCGLKRETQPANSPTIGARRSIA